MCVEIAERKRMCVSLNTLVAKQIHSKSDNLLSVVPFLLFVARLRVTPDSHPARGDVGR